MDAQTVAKIQELMNRSKTDRQYIALRIRYIAEGIKSLKDIEQEIWQLIEGSKETE